MTLDELEQEAARRGAAWAERTVRAMVGRWPVRWPRSPRSLALAGRKIADLVHGSAELQGRLARYVVDAAAQRYADLVSKVLP